MFRAMPPPARIKTRNHAPSLQRAAMVSPRLICLYMLTPMPVKIWMTPSTREPIRTISASSSGENRDHRGTLSGSTPVRMPRIWGIRSPKKPPVRNPQINVLIPHSPIRGIM